MNISELMLEENISFDANLKTRSEVFDYLIDQLQIVFKQINIVFKNIEPSSLPSGNFM